MVCLEWTVFVGNCQMIEVAVLWKAIDNISIGLRDEVRMKQRAAIEFFIATSLWTTVPFPPYSPEIATENWL